MKKIVHILISAAAVLALTILNYNNAAAQQTTKVLYISPTGNDVNTCTFSAPCKTFNRAQSLAVAGDTIQASGTFAPINITKSITVRGGTYDGAGQSESICVKINADNVTVDGVTALNCTSHGIISFKANAIIQNSTVKNSVLENASRQMNGGWASCIKGERGSVNLTVRNNRVENCYGEGIAITMTLGALVEGNTVIDAYSVLYYVDNSSNVIVSGNYGTCTGNSLFNRGTSRPMGIALGEEYYSGWGTQLHDINISSNTIQGCEKGIIAFGSIGVLRNITISRNTIPTGIVKSIVLDGASNSNVLIEYNNYFNTP
ncbi:MAG: right-handed parallel beta-helix repeat-containing protein [Anaerolineales bacterium]|uniref:right-handed parallel beta-helix repeat-containing protein n=1 Tax=Candidatus Villigracilis vicinus TaxID=3140679 RepID=UPI003136CE07|nr:right-handed parallel beta-helix repeat-containing protein [Anaerolineales bacterium]